jgi:tripartite-type tricarboxylate transporter receptor subunit TctC
MLNVPVVVENRSGANGMIGTDAVVRSAPDGYTLFTYSSTLWLIPLMRKETPYDPVRDFAPVTLVGSSPMVLVTHPSVAATSMKELIALAKAKPGELNFASGPTGAIPHLAGELFKAMAGINIVHIGYKGVGLAVTDVIGGRIQMMFPNASAALPQVKAGRLRAHAVSSAQPSSLAPGLPTVAEAGLPGYECVAMYAVFVPAKTPPAVLSRLHAELVGIMALPEVREKLVTQDVIAVSSTPEEFGQIIRRELERWGPVVKASGFTAED